jgi:hypothetical protein
MAFAVLSTNNFGEFKKTLDNYYGYRYIITVADITVGVIVGRSDCID